MSDAASNTIFGTWWFRPERPAFNRIAKLSDLTLSVALLLVALAIIIVALYPNRALLKAVVLSWIILP